MDHSAMNSGLQQTRGNSILVINGAYLKKTELAERLAQEGFVTDVRPRDAPGP